jgi:hypothetical protein
MTEKPPEDESIAEGFVRNAKEGLRVFFVLCALAVLALVLTALFPGIMNKTLGGYQARSWCDGEERSYTLMCKRSIR